MGKESAIVRRFLKANKPNEYHLITQEVYDAIEKLVSDVDTKEVNTDRVANKLRSVNGHLNQAKLYKEKGYMTGVDQNLDMSLGLIGEVIDELTKKEG